jgi:pimeloyl-ACP methyl ester carboxylesterase
MRVASGNAEIYYEVEGDGIPLIFVEGLGYSSWMWMKQKKMSDTIKIIIFDNRGVGKSSKPGNPYTVKEMCEDITSVANSAGIDKFYLLGSSMGGIIAQEYALNHENRLLGLILGETNTGVGSIMPGKDVLKVLATPTNPNSIDDLRYRMSFAFSKHYLANNKEDFENFLQIRYSERNSDIKYMQQLAAIANFSSVDRLGALSLPVCILTGDEDNIVPPENSRVLGNKIRNSTQVIIRKTGHLSMIERPDAFNRSVLNFINAVNQGNFKPVKESRVI